MPVQIKLVTLGHLLEQIDLKKIARWRSELFKITVEDWKIPVNAETDLPGFIYSDNRLRQKFTDHRTEGIVLALTSVPLEGNYITRPIPEHNTVILSLNGLSCLLNSHHIPLENLVLRISYSISILYQKFNNRLPTISQALILNHTEIKGCIFDMAGRRDDIIYSINQPTICDVCSSKLSQAPNALLPLEKIKTELHKIKKNPYYKIADFIAEKPILAILISSLTALLLGIIGSLIASWMWGT